METRSENSDARQQARSLSVPPATNESSSAVRTPHLAPSDELGDLLLDRGDFQIRLANTSCRGKSDQLVDRMYSWRGYKVEGQSAAPARRQITLQTCSGTDVFGTLNVGFDSAAGLASDSLYESEIDTFRASGAVVAEFTRLAVDSEFGSKELLGALFHVAYLCAAVAGRATDMFIEVNPRHVPFYKRMLNFLPAGECKICPRVDAPAVLLHCEVAYMRAQAERLGGNRESNSRTLYPYYCTPDEAREIAQRIATVCPPWPVSAAGATAAQQKSLPQAA